MSNLVEQLDTQTLDFRNIPEALRKRKGASGRPEMKPGNRSRGTPVEHMLAGGLAPPTEGARVVDTRASQSGEAQRARGRKSPR